MTYQKAACIKKWWSVSSVFDKRRQAKWRELTDEKVYDIQVQLEISPL
jgi:hypothetical protein